MSQHRVRRYNGSSLSLFSWYMHPNGSEWDDQILLRITMDLNVIQNITVVFTTLNSDADDLDVPDYSLLSEEELFQYSCTTNYDVHLAAKMIQRSKDMQRDILSRESEPNWETTVEL